MTVSSTINITYIGLHVNVNYFFGGEDEYDNTEEGDRVNKNCGCIIILIDRQKFHQDIIEFLSFLIYGNLWNSSISIYIYINIKQILKQTQTQTNAPI